jgi:hypothetical protein
VNPAIANLFCIVRKPQVAAPPRNRRKLFQDSLALGYRRRVDPSGTTSAVSHAGIVVEDRTARPQQPSVAACRRASNRGSVQANDGQAGAQELIDTREAATTKSDDARIGVCFADERGIRRTGVGVPNGRSRTQK